MPTTFALADQIGLALAAGFERRTTPEAPGFRGLIVWVEPRDEALVAALAHRGDQLGPGRAFEVTFYLDSVLPAADAAGPSGLVTLITAFTLPGQFLGGLIIAIRLPEQRALLEEVVGYPATVGAGFAPKVLLAGRPLAEDEDWQRAPLLALDLPASVYAEV